jgi:hypothetical protein
MHNGHTIYITKTKKCPKQAAQIKKLRDALEHIRDNAMTSTKEATARVAGSALANNQVQVPPKAVP